MWIERFASRRCHFLIFVNAGDMVTAMQKGISRYGRFSYIPNGVDPERFRPEEEPEVRKSHVMRALAEW